MDEGRRLPSDPLVEIVPATRKPLRGLSRFAVSTARREIHDSTATPSTARDCKMVSYDIDRQEVQALDTDLQDDYQITPYVPYLSELFLGVIGAHKLAH